MHTESGVMAELMMLLYTRSSCCIGSKFPLCHKIKVFWDVTLVHWTKQHSVTFQKMESSAAWL